MHTGTRSDPPLSNRTRTHTHARTDLAGRTAQAARVEHVRPNKLQRQRPNRTECVSACATAFAAATAAHWSIGRCIELQQRRSAHAVRCGAWIERSFAESAPPSSASSFIYLRRASRKRSGWAAAVLPSASPKPRNDARPLQRPRKAQPAALKGNNGCALRRRAVRRAYDQRSRCQPTVLIGTVTCEANQQRTISEHAGCRANRPQRNRISPTDRSNGIHWLRRSAECCSRAQRRRMCGTAAVLHGMAALGWFTLSLQIAAARSDRV